MQLEKFNEFLIYDKRSGKLFWNKEIKRHTQLLGKEVGSVFINNGGNKKRKYRRFRLFGKVYFSHRIIWFLNYGYMPNIIDHIDGNGLNNKLSNLRDVSLSENQKNRYTHRNGRLFGTTFFKRNNKWMSVKIIGKSRIHLGYYKTEEEAHIIYLLFNDFLSERNTK